MSNENDDPVYLAVQACCDALIKSLGDSKLINVHFLCGGPSTAGAIRKSAVFLRTADPANATAGLAVFRENVRRFHRDSIFISLVEGWAALTESGEAVLSFSRSEALQDVSLSFEVVGRLANYPSAHGARLALSPDLIDQLCPKELSLKYMTGLYTRPAMREESAQPFVAELELRRCVVLGMAKRSAGVEKDAAEFVLGRALDKDDFLANTQTLSRVLAGLQLALLYFRHASAAGGLDGEAVFFVKKYDPDYLGSAATLVVVAYPGPSESVDYAAVFKEMESAWTKIHASLRVELQVPRFTPQFYGKDGEHAADQEKIGRQVEQLFQIRRQKQVAVGVTNWLLWLTEKLEGTRHEGHTLDFWFVIGDRTQFEDSRWIQVRRFAELKIGFPEIIDPLGVPSEPTDTGGNESQRDRAAKVLTGEHYPWFQGGKYALLWDVTAVSGKPFLLPYGLASIVGSNWEQYLTQYYTGTRHIELPSNVLVYTLGRVGETGLMLGTDRGLKRVLLLRNRHWRLSDDDEREKCLKNQVLKAPVIQADDLRAKIGDIILRVADSPIQGGTLIVLNPDSDPSEFTSMGIPWQFSDNPQDIEALMAHDGATILQEVSGGTPRWRFRLLLSGDGVSAQVQKVLEELLLGAGARRWSAALTAFRKGVQAVVVISQDGDISCWSTLTGSVEDAELYVLRRGERPARLSLREGLGEPVSPIGTG